jgi:hypothetical protein
MVLSSVLEKYVEPEVQLDDLSDLLDTVDTE